MLQSWSIARTFNTDVKRLLSTSGIVGFAYFGVTAVLFNLYLLRLGFDVKFIGLLIASGQVVWGVASLPAAAIGRRIGLRTAIAIGFAAVAFGMGSILLVEALPHAWWAAWIVGGWLISWGGSALFTVNSTPYYMSASAVAERNHVFAASAALSTIMTIAGSLIAGLLPRLYIAIFGGTLDDTAPYRAALWLVPLGYAAATVVMTGARQIRLESHTSSQSHTREGAPFLLLLFIGVIVFLLATGGGAVTAFFNVFLDTSLKVPSAQIGAIMGVARILPFFVALITPLLLERWGTARTLMLMGIAIAAALVALGLSGQWFLAAVSFAAATSFVALSATARSLFSQEAVAEQWRSISSAVVNIGVALGWAASAALGGYLIGAWGFYGYFFTCAMLCGLSSIILVIYERMSRFHTQVAPAE